MKRNLIVLFFILFQFSLCGQCSTVSVQISSSDTAFIQLYQAGFFNIPSGFDNICEWEVTSFAGEIIHEDITSGEFNDQSTSPFNHEIPITDSMKVSIVITNNTEGIICTIRDTLYWKETEVLPGSFIGNWSVLSSNGGVEEMISSTKNIDSSSNIETFPNPTSDYFLVNGDENVFLLILSDLEGRTVEYVDITNDSQIIDLSAYPPGLLLARFYDKKRNVIAIKKVIKL